MCPGVAVDLANFVCFHRNRMLQHYTSNPLSAFTGKIDHPMVKVEYLQQHEEHFGEKAEFHL